MTFARLAAPALALALTLTCSPALQAAALTCSGTVEAVQLDNLGAVFIQPSWRGDFVQICSSAATWKNVTTATCKNWTAAALLAYTTGAQLLIYYPSTSAAACLALPTFGSADAPGQLTNQ